MNQTAEHSRILESLIRIGTVAEVDHTNALCRVQSGELLTDWLPWLTPRAGKVRIWSPPSVGEQVILFSQSGEVGAGVVLPGLFSDAMPAPSSAATVTCVAFPDGALLSYNHDSGALSVTGIKTALIQASDSVTVDCPETTTTGNLTVGGDLVIKGDSTFKGKADVLGAFSYAAGMSGTGGEGGGATTITGPITQSGGALTSNGVVLHDHTHDKVQRGNDSTGGPK
ncbi:phage baseplate assembly protein V [Iodobacter fluviatilis]|uniref:Phage P2 baseplate assembly protein gpV n=1 Tax=Iodobacter fluviatilis TaxID=537 RepID=A0A377Q3B8_9NEIS|nr:phage baseplate assembly protein V [Iodobacter fluviatilis]TCU90265.1 phage baseplate assembly protein V [Iodobacter fluviatilis]STQ89292.1 Phage P2 baseplate assembly protein gpV [Iodobacter fluviatilis]